MKKNWPASKVEMRNVSELVPYANNSRTHSQQQIDQIAASINEWGWTVPVLVDEKGMLIAGHGRIMAAQKLGIEQVPTMTATGWTEAQKKAYVIADNKLALNADWNNDLLKLEIGNLEEMEFDISLLGFSIDELADLSPIETIEGLVDEDEVPELQDAPVTKMGDVWLLGKHRMMCGDSTSIDAVEKLMQGQKANMIFTDPPYGVSYTGGLQNGKGGLSGDKRQMIKNDDIDLYEDAVVTASTFCDGPVFMFYADTVPFGLYRGIERVGGDVVALLIWKKKGGYGALGASYKPNHEPCVLWKTKGSKLNFIGSTTENRVWEIDKEGINKLHPTQKPVEVPERAIRNHKADIVLDLFGGSGSTLIACERAGRAGRLMELDPKYCDVIIKRWMQFTGKEAVLEQSGQKFGELEGGNDR